MSIFSDRRSLRQIGGVRGYLRQVTWSIKWRLEWRRRRANPVAVQPPPIPSSTEVAAGRVDTDRGQREQLR